MACQADSSTTVHWVTASSRAKSVTAQAAVTEKCQQNSKNVCVGSHSGESTSTATTYRYFSWLCYKRKEKHQGLRNGHGEYEIDKNCQMERKMQKYWGRGKKILCISWHMLPIKQNFSMWFLFTTHKIPFIEICELVNAKVINVFLLKNWFINDRVYFFLKNWFINARVFQLWKPFWFKQLFKM